LQYGKFLNNFKRIKGKLMFKKSVFFFLIISSLLVGASKKALSELITSTT